MAKLINGNGNKAIWAAQDADLIAALIGNVTGIAKVGNKFAATQEDANTIGLSDGVIVTKEGRRIQLDVGNVDLFDIPTGTAGVTSYYIIGYHLITNSDSSQTCETFVQKMDNATDVITENTFRGGATEVYVSCYRVVQDGLNIDSINALLPELENISTLVSKKQIYITGGAGETMQQALNRLFNAADKSKISVLSVLAFGVNILHISRYDGTTAVYEQVYVSGDNNKLSECALAATGSTYKGWNGGTVTDLSSLSAAGLTFVLSY